MGMKDRATKQKGMVANKGTNGESILSLYPKFSFTHLKGDYSLSQCTKDEKASLADTLYQLSQVTWNVIFHAPRHGIGFEKIAFDSTKGIREDFKEKGLIAFRFYGKAPMLGYREQETFYILALDRNFTCYNHG